MVEKIEELSIEQLKMLQKSTNKKIIVKFSAPWCAPCQRIKEHVNLKFLEVDENKTIIADIDIDKDEELFQSLKKNKMVRGIPSILMWDNVERENWYIPDDSVVGSKIDEIDSFFYRCK